MPPIFVAATNIGGFIAVAVVFPVPSILQTLNGSLMILSLKD
jgi:hypothetical protein